MNDKVLELLKKLRDSGRWYYSAFEIDVHSLGQTTDGETLLEEIEQLIKELEG